MEKSIRRADRKQILLSYVCQNTHHNTEDVLKFAEDNGISQTTARRDLKELESEGIIKMIYGAISFLGLGERSCPIDIKHRNINFEKKLIIARKATTLLEKNDVIFVGGGSTCEIFVSQIDKPVKIITNSLRVLNFARLNPNIEYYILLGGKLRDQSNSFYGSFCEESLSLINYNRVVITAKNIDEKGLLYKSNEEMARVELAALSKVREKILLLDHTKANQIGFFGFYNVKDMKYLVSDNPTMFKHLVNEDSKLNVI